jgi:probable rRNA maturation factor
MSVRCSDLPPGVTRSRIDPSRLASRAQRLLRILKHDRSELSIKLADDAEMSALNGAWRGQARPTDVLSFSLVEGDYSDYRGELLGDIVIGVETAARQAREQHRSLEEVVTRLLIHGILHLLGHDHAQDEGARRMRVEERRMWRVMRS